jgi:tetratricopeptide (TPR) repeat protein
VPLLAKSRSRRLLCLLGLGLLLAPAAARAADSLSAGAGQALSRARMLMAAGDNEGAAAAASAAVREQPQSGSALLVLGMAHFRGGRYPEALAAFRSARTAPQPPAPGTLAFNEGAALFALNRFADAEAAFQEAGTRDSRLGCLAELNAGQAALSAGALPRARAHLRAAQQLAGAAQMSKELEDLRADIDRRESQQRVQQAERAYADGVARLRAGQAREAGALFEQAASLDPDEADYHLMWGQAALEADEPVAARRALERALALGLDPEDIATARSGLDSLSLGLRRQGSGPSLSFDLGSGYDSNVAQLSEGRPDAISGETPNAGDFWGLTALDVAYDRSLGPAFFAEVEYALEQRAYRSAGFDTYNLQSHVVTLRGELTPGGPVRLGLALEGEYQLAGLRDFGFFQRAFAVEPQIALDEGTRTATVLRLKGRAQDAEPAEDHLDGRRVELRLEQIWRSRSLRAEIGARHRREKIGTRNVDLGRLGRRELAQGRYLVPYGYTSNGLSGSASLALGQRLRLGVDGSVERLRYDADNVVLITGALGRMVESGRVRRKDDRLAAGARVSVALTEVVDLTARYELSINRSNVRYAFDDKNYSKQDLSLTLGIGF